MAFPFAVIAAFIGLIVARISGSSIGALTAARPVPGLLAGEPRSVRSDEFLLTTPSNISSVEQGFPFDPWIGLAPTDLEVAVHSGISLDWTTWFHPDDWGYLLLGADMGLAFTWWWSFVISLCAVYAFIGLLTRAPGLSALLAIIATFTPYSAWWSAAPPSLVLGYGAAIGACILLAARVRQWWLALMFALLGGYVSAVFALVLYPPWSISVALVVAAATIGYFLDSRVDWLRVGWTLGVIVVAAGAVLLGWFLDNRPAIDALAGTYYPGSRVTQAGGGSFRQMLSSPLNFWLAGAPGGTFGKVPGSGTLDNLSEISSSWLPFPVVILIAVGVGQLVYRRWTSRRSLVKGSRRSRDGAPLWRLILVGIVFGLIFAWAMLPLPDWIGTITFLNRVQASRTPLALGFAIVLLVAFAAQVPKRPRAWSSAWAVASAGFGAALAIWAAFSLLWEHELVPMTPVLVSGFVLALAFALVFCIDRPLWPAAVMAVYALVSWALVNPIQQGTAPLTDDPLVHEIQDVVDGAANPRAMVFGDFIVVAKARAAGLQSVSGQTPIPDAKVMNELAPDAERQWNNYVKYQWHVGASGTPLTIEQRVGTTLDLTVDPCWSTLLATVDPGWAVSDRPIAGDCLSKVGQTAGLDNRTYYIYEVID